MIILYELIALTYIFPSLVESAEKSFLAGIL